jgi:tetratricopeptide (TPR) repeat protein
MIRFLRLALVAGALSLLSFAQSPSQSGTTNSKPPASAPLPRSDSGESPSLDTLPETAPPEGANESSSNDTRIDLSPPKNDAKDHPDSEDPTAGDVTEMHPWNPHKAEKDIEVGEFYLKRKNLRAAESRFREALTYKPNDAVASFRLGEVLEQENQTSEARKNYEAYLKILPQGKFADDARKGLERINEKAAK